MYRDAQGRAWYKGNLHTHSKRSDGRLEPEQIFRMYADHGYDFIALTEHWKQSPDGESDRLLTIPGIELDFSRNAREGIFHIVGVGMSGEIDVSRRGQMTAQEMIDEINLKGGAAVLAHPAWSLNTPEQIMSCEGIAALEVFNSVSDKPHNVRPDSSLLSDMVSARGRFINLTAVDDAHFYDGEACRSFVYLQTDVLDREHIVEALKKGAFYATQGPRFSYSWDPETLTCRVTTTPASDITFFSDAAWVGHRVFSEARGDGELQTETTYVCQKNETFIRFEITDFMGRKAWSSPIKVREI